MVSSHLRHFGTLSSAGEGTGGGGGLKKWKYQHFKHFNLSSHFLSICLGTGVWNWNLKHQFKSISCAVCIYFSDKFYSCSFPCPNFCHQWFALFFALALALFFALKTSAKKRARAKSLFCPLIHFPMYFALKFCPCPVILPWTPWQKKRAGAKF